MDVSSEMIAMLREKAGAADIENLETLVRSIEALDIEPSSVDLVVSNYALHHLRDHDKRELVRRTFTWLRPGGQLVIGDMMFGRGATSQDRRVILTKIKTMARRGPAGWWRILKNMWRFSLRVSEKPLTTSAWEALARETGFVDVRIRPVVQEACVLSATKPTA